MSLSEQEAKSVVKVVLLAFVLCLLSFGGCLVGGPQYNVWKQRMEGNAQLARSESSKQVMVQDAKAKEESAKYQAQAEVIRAEGVAKANKIIGESLKNNDGYLHYLWIHNLELGNHDVIYIPTETGLPIFEAGGRFKKEYREQPASGEAGTAEHPDAKPGEGEGNAVDQKRTPYHGSID